MTFQPRPLPTSIRQLCEKLEAPPQLIAHLTLVHDTAMQIVSRLRQQFRMLSFDVEAVLLVRRATISAKYARTHGAWNRGSLPLPGLLIVLADCVWKGQQLEALETQIVSPIADKTDTEEWDVFDKLDGLLDEIARHGEERLAWQARKVS